MPTVEEMIAAEDARRQQQKGVTASGTGKAVATGVRGGIEGLIGAPADLVTWETRKAAEIAEWLGASPEVVEAIKNYGQEPTRGPGMATTPDVAAATDVGVNALPQSVSGPIQDITRHEPQNVTEEWAQTAGSFAPAALLPGSAAVRAARVAIPTAGVETTGQVTRKLAPEYEDAARLVAGIVFGGGQALAEGGFRLRSNLRKLNTTPGGMSRVQQLLKEQGMTPQEAATAIKELGPEGMLVDVGSDTGAVLRQEGQRIQARGGEGRTILEEPLRAREQGVNERLEGDVQATVGDRLQRSDVLAGLKDRAAALSPEYEAAHKAQTQPVPTQSIAEAIESDLAIEKSGSVRKRLQDIRESLNLRGTGELDPSTEGLHSARRAIDDVLYDSQGKPRDIGGGEAAILKRYRSQIDEALAASGPIKEVDVKRAQVGKEERAFATGEEIYENPRGAPSEVEFKRTFDTMTPGEQQHVLKGLNVETYRQLGINANDRTKLLTLLKGEGKWNQQKLATVVGEEKAQGLMDALKREKIFQESHQAIVRGSKTAETVGGGAPESLSSAAAKAIPEMITSGAIAGPWASGGVAVVKLQNWLKQQRAAGKQGRLDADVAKLLASGRGDDLVQAAKLMAEKQGGAPQVVLDALLSRQHELSERKGQ